MYAKLLITGTVESLTGMHIGGSSQFAAIGAVDSPVMMDVSSGNPMIPGSSLKGKLRTLLASQYSENGRLPRTHAQDDERIRRLFGWSETGKAKSSRLIFSDLFLSNAEELAKIGVLPTEVKFENTINRLTGVANPRQIERSVRGAKYGLRLIYNVEAEEEIEEDFTLLRDAMKLLQFDYLGGHGSRGYGKIRFTDLQVTCAIGDCDQSVVDHCGQLLKEVEV